MTVFLFRNLFLATSIRYLSHAFRAPKLSLLLRYLPLNQPHAVSDIRLSHGVQAKHEIIDHQLLILVLSIRLSPSFHIRNSHYVTTWVNQLAILIR